MARPPVDRGEMWLVDLGMAAKVRPAVVLSVAPGPADVVLFTIVPHATSPHGSGFEAAVSATFLKPGMFNAQGW